MRLINFNCFATLNYLNYFLFFLIWLQKQKTVIRLKNRNKYLYVAASHPWCTALHAQRASARGVGHLAQGHLARTACYWWTHKLGEEDVIWHYLLTGRGSFATRQLLHRERPPLPSALMHSRAVPAAHLPSARAIMSAAEFIDHRHLPEMSLPRAPCCLQFV